MDEIRIPPAADPVISRTRLRDDTIEAHYASLERACGCYDGYHYLGHMVDGGSGEEVEVVEGVPCRRCSPRREEDDGRQPSTTSD